jgi:hypothetical protein
MAHKTSVEEAKKLMETVSFELDTDLRLHVQQLDLGKAELLTDALTLPYMDIEKLLEQYITSASDVDRMDLQQRMKAYLAKLNANPLIPLQFRLKVLNNFERELNLFDSEMTAAVLNAHKIGIALVQKAARSETSYYRILVDMVSNALELATKMMRIGLLKYRPAATLTNRQSFDLMRLGLSVLTALPENAVLERDRLLKIVSSHEFQRKIDFFGKSNAKQEMIWNELEHHIATLEPKLIRKGAGAPELADKSYMVTNLIRPHEAAKIFSKIPDTSAYDMIVIPLDKFIDRMVTAINRVETLLKSADLQKKDLHTEKILYTTIMGGNAILDTMRKKDRAGNRKDKIRGRLVLEQDSATALKESRSPIEIEYLASESENADAWSVVDITKQGVGLERLSDHGLEVGVDALVGLTWIPNEGEPLLGIIRWIKEPKPGEMKMGIQFLRQRMKLYRGVRVIKGKDDINLRRNWPVLIKPGKSCHTAVFPDTNVFNKMIFRLSDEETTALFQVIKVEKTGPNFSSCKVTLIDKVNTSKLKTSEADPGS